MIELIVLLMLFGWIPAMRADYKGRSMIGWWVAGTLCLPLAWIILNRLPSLKTPR